MSKKIIIILGLLAIILLAYFCIKAKSPTIESDLVTRSNTALVSENIRWANVSTDGRELRLTGVAPTEALRLQAGKVAQNIRGVNTVDNQLTVESNVATEPKDYNLVVNYDGVNVVLEGYVPDESVRNDVVEAAKARVGRSNVMDKLTIESGAPSGWSDSIKQAVIDQLKNYTSLTASFNNTDLSISGNVASVKLRDQLQQRSAQVLQSSYSLIEFNVEVNVIEEAATVLVDAISCQKRFNDLLSTQIIYFETSKAVIQKKSDALIDELATVALKCPDTNIEIAGHTDSSGSHAMNQKLSEMRAKAIVKRLKEKNINEDRLTAIGYGETKPIADNKTEIGKAKNRRIEFKIIGD
ncbi:MAG: OmpA family protein [Thiomicrorhabdus sp.]|nr:OmpA family protein [Thiomicrorhabdus sp.]